MKFKIYLRRPTRATIRMVVWSLFVLFFVTVCMPLLFFYYLFDANKVKHMVISQFNNQNYSVIIHGNVEPRSWHGLSLFISDLTVEDNLQKKVLHINTANCQLSWLDLIVGHYLVKRIALNGLTFYQNNLDNANYPSLLDYHNLAKSEFNKLKYLSISNLTLIDQKNNSLIKDAGLYITDLDENPGFNLQFKIANYDANVNIRGQVIESNNSLLIKQLNTVMVSPKLRIDLQSSGDYSYKTRELRLNNNRGVVSGLNFQGGVLINNALLSSTGVTMDTMLATLNGVQSNAGKTISLHANHIATANFSSYTAGSIVAKYDVSGQNNSFEGDLQLNNAVLDSLLNFTTASCSLNFKSTISKPQQVLAGGALTGECGFFARQNLLNFNLNGRINQSPARLNLSYFAGKPKLTIKLVGSMDSLDLAKLMASSQTNLLPLYSDGNALPFAWLNDLDLDADLKFNYLNMHHLNLTKVNTHVIVKNNSLVISKLQANVYDGMISGSALVENLGESSNIKIKNKISNVNLQKLFASWFNVNAIRGRGTLVIDTVANNVITYEDLHKKLNGTIALTVSDGGFNGIDFSLFLSPENLAAFQNKNSVITHFTELSSQFNFESGVARNSVLTFNSPTIMARGTGTVDFAKTQLNYRLNVSSILPKNIQNVKSVSIPVLINGDLFNPKIYIQNITLNTTSSHKEQKEQKVQKEQKGK